MDLPPFSGDFVILPARAEALRLVDVDEVVDIKIVVVEYLDSSVNIVNHIFLLLHLKYLQIK